MASIRKWLSSVRRFVACGGNSLSNDSSKRTVHATRRGRRKLKRISLFKEPTSSIEKILKDAETHQSLVHRHPSPSEQPKKSSVAVPKASTPRATSPASPKVTSPVASSPRTASPVDISPTPSPPSRTEPVFPHHHVAATKIQSAYRSYMSRTSNGSARGLMRLQRFVRGQSVMRQTDNSTKQMQLLVRVKTRVASQRSQSDAGNDGDWDRSVLSKEETEARNTRRAETVRNRERAKTLLQTQGNGNGRSTQMEPRTDALMWSWNWSELHLLNTIIPTHHQAKKKASSTPPISGTSKSPTNSQFRTPSDMNFTDTDSLRSSYSYSVPRYMTPTASAKAKMRVSDNFHDKCISSHSIESNRRLSYPLTPRSGASRGGLRGSNHSSGTAPESFPDGRKPFNRFV